MKVSRFSSLVAAVVLTGIQWVLVCNLPAYAQSIGQ